MKTLYSFGSETQSSRFCFNVEQYNNAREELGDVIASIREELEKNKLDSVDVKTGYTLGESVAALANKPMAEVMKMSLKYESVRGTVYGSNLPKTVKEARWIYPGQSITLENGVVVVRDKSMNIAPKEDEWAPAPKEEGWAVPEGVDEFAETAWNTVINKETWSNIGEGAKNGLKAIGGGFEDVFDGTAYEGLKNHLNTAGDMTMVDILAGVGSGALWIVEKGGEVIIWTGSKVGEGVSYVLKGDEAKNFKKKKEAVEKGFFDRMYDGTVDLYDSAGDKVQDAKNLYQEYADEYLGVESTDARDVLRDYISGKDIDEAVLLRKIQNVETIDENLAKALQVEKVRKLLTGKKINFSQLTSIDAGAYKLMENWNIGSLTFEKLENLNLPKDSQGNIDVRIQEWSFPSLSFKSLENVSESEAVWLSRFKGNVYLPSLNEDTDRKIIDSLDSGTARVHFNDAISDKRMEWNGNEIIDNNALYQVEKDIIESGDWKRTSQLKSLSNSKFGGMPEGYSDDGFISALKEELSLADSKIDVVDFASLEAKGINQEQLTSLAMIPLDIKFSNTDLKKQLNATRNQMIVKGLEGDARYLGVALSLLPLESITLSDKSKAAMKNYIQECCMGDKHDWADNEAALAASYQEVFGDQGIAIRARVESVKKAIDVSNISLSIDMAKVYLQGHPASPAKANIDYMINNGASAEEAALGADWQKAIKEYAYENIDALSLSVDMVKVYLQGNPASPAKANIDYMLSNGVSAKDAGLDTDWQKAIKKYYFER